MNNIVMVGHSMGGLITRFNNSTKPWTLMKGLFELPPETFARHDDGKLEKRTGAPEL